MLRARTTMTALLMAAAALTGAGNAAAEEGAHWKVGINAGTLGFGPEVGYRLNSFFGARVNGGFYSFSHDDEQDDFAYQGKLKLKSVGALADIFPFGGGFRVSVGARSNKDRVTVDAVPTADVEIDDTTYTPAEVGAGTGTINFKKFSPMATIGWGGGFSNGFSFGIEAGLMLQGSPQIEVTTTGSLSQDPTFRAKLDKEISDAEDDAKDYKYWPVIQLNFSWRF